MMGSCTVVGMLFGIPAMLTPIITLGAIVYLIVTKQKNTDLHEAH